MSFSLGKNGISNFISPGQSCQKYHQFTESVCLCVWKPFLTFFLSLLAYFSYSFDFFGNYEMWSNSMSGTCSHIQRGFRLKCGIVWRRGLFPNTYPFSPVLSVGQYYHELFHKGACYQNRYRLQPCDNNSFEWVTCRNLILSWGTRFGSCKRSSISLHYIPSRI